jgi:hypothetical protein
MMNTGIFASSNARGGNAGDLPLVPDWPVLNLRVAYSLASCTAPEPHGFDRRWEQLSSSSAQALAGHGDKAAP